MPETETTAPETGASAATPKTADLLLATFADLYRQEVNAEEDVYRTLPFFGTALGIVIGALAYAAGRLPKWRDVTAMQGSVAFVTTGILLGLAIFEAGCVLVWLSRTIARHRYQRIGPEPDLRARVTELQAYYDARGLDGEDQDRELLNDFRQVLLESYCATTPANREINQRRYRFRARAASHLVRSLIWALGATTVIFVTDKLGFLPKASP
jgi:hypothetical protein